MAKQNRSTLKNYFSDGALPSSEHYSDLVDSMVTWMDDGFDKTRTDGLRIKSYAQEKSLISFYRGVGEDRPSWTIAHGPDETETLLFVPTRQNGGSEAPRAGLSMAPDGAVGVRFDRPEWDLDVDGVARMRGRIGFPMPGHETVAADGEWHDVTLPLQGCNILEVVAGVGGKRETGRYALLRAIAMNAYHPRGRLLNWLFERRRIRQQTAVFGSYGDRLRLRWVRATEPSREERRQGQKEARTYNRPYKLQLRTSSSYGSDYSIRYYVTQLWFDTEMEGSRPGGADRDSTFRDARGRVNG